MGPVGWFQGEQHVNLCQLNQLHFCVSWALVGLFLWSHWDIKETEIKQYKYFEVLPYFCISSSIITLVPWMVSIWDLTTGCPGVRSHIETVHGLPKKASIFKVFCAKQHPCQGLSITEMRRIDQPLQLEKSGWGNKCLTSTS